MAEENDPAMAEIMNLLEAESGSSGTAVTPASDIPTLRKQLAILVNTGKAKASSRWNTWTKNMLKSTTKGTRLTWAPRPLKPWLKAFWRCPWKHLRIKDADALQNELKNDYITTKELSALAGGLTVRCGRLITFANVALITTYRFQRRNRAILRKYRIMGQLCSLIPQLKYFFTKYNTQCRTRNQPTRLNKWLHYFHPTKPVESQNAWLRAKLSLQKQNRLPKHRIMPWLRHQLHCERGG